MRGRVAFGRERPHEGDPILEPQESARKAIKKPGGMPSSPGARGICLLPQRTCHSQLVAKGGKLLSQACHVKSCRCSHPCLPNSPSICCWSALLKLCSNKCVRPVISATTKYVRTGDGPSEKPCESESRHQTSISLVQSRRVASFTLSGGRGKAGTECDFGVRVLVVGWAVKEWRPLPRPGRDNESLTNNCQELHTKAFHRLKTVGGPVPCPCFCACSVSPRLASHLLWKTGRALSLVGVIIGILLLLSVFLCRLRARPPFFSPTASDMALWKNASSRFFLDFRPNGRR